MEKRRSGVGGRAWAYVRGERRTRILRRRRRCRLGELVRLQVGSTGGREGGSESRAAAIKGAFPPSLSSAATVAEFLVGEPASAAKKKQAQSAFVHRNGHNRGGRDKKSFACFALQQPVGRQTLLQITLYFQTCLVVH